MIRFPFDETLDPPAPVVPLRITHPHLRDGAVVLSALIDTGADSTCIPVAVASRLRLPIVDVADVEGVGGLRNRVRIHSARVEVATIRILASVVALGDEAIVGRDVLSRAFFCIDGPQRVTTFRRRK